MQKIILVIGILAIVGMSLYSFGSQEDYPTQIGRQRKEKDEFFKTSSQSPIKRKKQFKGLAYFPVNTDYKLTAQLEKIQPAEALAVTTSKGTKETYTKFARAKFSLLGKEYRLVVLRKGRMPQLFIPFTDATSGRETYGGGRYLELAYKNETTEIALDFNLAFHPYCVYNYDYVCPIPPAENALPVGIYAGERLGEYPK